jgi:hypothetical protein
MLVGPLMARGRAAINAKGIEHRVKKTSSGRLY